MTKKKLLPIGSPVKIIQDTIRYGLTGEIESQSISTSTNGENISYVVRVPSSNNLWPSTHVTCHETGVKLISKSDITGKDFSKEEIHDLLVMAIEEIEELDRKKLLVTETFKKLQLAYKKLINEK